MRRQGPRSAVVAVRKQKERRQRLVLGAVAVLGLAAIAALAVSLLSSNSAGAPVGSGRLDDAPALGPATAPVTLVEYGDFGCPSCRAWHRSGVLNQIRQTYGDKVRFVWRDFPVITAQSPKAAEAGQCAYDQGKFWEYHDLVYASVSDNGVGLDVNSLKGYAQKVGLDTTKFNQCLDSGQDKAVVQHNLELAQKLGFRGTPSFTLNGQVYTRNIDFNSMKSAIDQALGG